MEYLSGRALHYFIHQSSKDLTGPFQSQVWREFVLRVCVRSPAVQHAIAALSGFHERYTLPEAKASRVQCWQHYYLAVKSLNEFVQTTGCVEVKRDLADSTLVACAIFITIEVLLGNTETAIKHLEGSFSIIRQYLTKGLSELASMYRRRACILAPLDDAPHDLSLHMQDLIGWYSRLDLQVLEHFPRRHHLARKPQDAVLYATLQMFHPLPNGASVALYRLLKHSLYWIRHCADEYKYAKEIPEDVVAVREKLLLYLGKWYTTFEQKEKDHADRSVPIDSETANLLVVYHLTFLKLTTSLTPLETAYDKSECQNSFCAIISYCSLILLNRHPCNSSMALRDAGERSRFFFSLESSTIEPLFYTAIKCRERVWRQSALLLLKCAGREGIWNGLAMARAAEFVLSMEHGEGWRESAPFAGWRAYCWHSKISYAGGHQALLDMRDLHGGLEKVPEEARVNRVTVDMMCATARRFEVECGWFRGETGAWTRSTAALEW